jgi:hypothetical protein
MKKNKRINRTFKVETSLPKPPITRKKKNWISKDDPRFKEKEITRYNQDTVDYVYSINILQTIFFF